MKVHRATLCSSTIRTATGAARRFALVVQSDRNHQRLDDTIVVTISSRSSSPTEPTQLVIGLSTPAGQQSGLLFTSTVQCANILTVVCDFILRNIGSLPPDIMLQVNECLKLSLGIA